MKFKAISLLILSFNFIACGGKLSPNKVHEEAAAPAILDEKPIDTKTIELKAIDNLNANSASNNFLAEVKKEYLNEKNWQTPKIAYSNEFRTMLDKANKQLLALPAKDRWPELTDFYLNFCDELLKNCKPIATLRSSGYSSPLLTSLASEQKDLDKKYRLVLIAFELVNANYAKENIEVFLSDIKPYRQSLTKNNQKDLLSKIDSILSMILADAQAGKIEIKDKAWLESIELTKSLDTSFNYLAGKNWTTEKNGQVMPTEILKKEIETQQKLETSYSKKIQWLKENQERLLKQFDIQPLELDAYFFVVDQMMTDRWSAKQAEAFFTGSKMNLKQLQVVAKNYILTHIAYISGSTQFELQKFFKDNSKRDPMQFFNDTKSVLIKQFAMARNLPNRVRRIADLASLIDVKSEDSQKLSKLVANIEKTIKVSLSTPVTLAIFDLGLRIGIDPLKSIPITKYYLSGTVPFELLVQQFLRGDLPPLVDFTDDLDVSNRFEILEGLEFAYRSGIFEALNTSADDAATRLFDIYLQSNVYEAYSTMGGPHAFPSRFTLLQNSLRSIERVQKQPEWNDLRHLCKAVRSREKMVNRNLNLLDMAKSPTLGTLASKIGSMTDTTTMSTGVSSGTKVSTDLAFFPFNTLRVDQLEWLRLDYLPTIEAFSTIMRSAERNGVLMPKLKVKIESLKSLSKKYVLSFSDLVKESMDCFYTHFNREREIAAKVVNYEKQYWLWAISQAKSGNQNHDQIFKISLPTGINYRSRIQADTIVLYKFDLLLRIRTYLTKGIPELNLAPIAPEMNILINDGLSTKNIYVSSEIDNVPNSGNVEEDANSAVKAAGFTGSNNIIEWYNSTYIPVANFPKVMEGISSMARIAPYLQQTLGIEKYYSVDEMIQEQLKIHPFLNVSPLEATSLKILGKTERYLFHKMLSGYLQDEQNNPEPYMNFLLKLVANNWMGSIGDKDIWENPKNDLPFRRPSALVPWTTVGQNLFFFLTDRNENRSSFFKDQLTAATELAAHYKQAFQSDTTYQLKVAEKMHELKPITITIDIEKGSQVFEPYKSTFVENLVGTAERFHMDTGGMFRAP